MAELTRWRGKYGHHDLISLTDIYPLSYRDIQRGLPGLVPPYCALLDYKAFTELVVIVIQKFYFFLKRGRTNPRLPYYA